MIDGSEKRNRQLAFELQNSHVCEKRSNSQEKQDNAYAKCWGDKQRALWYVIYFLEWSVG